MTVNKEKVKRKIKEKKMVFFPLIEKAEAISNKMPGKNSPAFTSEMKINFHTNASFLKTCEYELNDEQLMQFN